MYKLLTHVADDMALLSAVLKCYFVFWKTRKYHTAQGRIALRQRNAREFTLMIENSVA